MTLYLIQHALSAPKEIDPERGITEEGRVQTSRMATFFAGQSPSVGEIWRSEKKRSGETAEILADALGARDRTRTREDLNPMDPVESLAKELAEIRENLVIVGHLPFLGRLVSLLLTNDPDREVLSFRNSGIVCLERTDTGWLLRWIHTPELLH